MQFPKLLANRWNIIMSSNWKTFFSFNPRLVHGNKATKEKSMKNPIDYLGQQLSSSFCVMWESTQEILVGIFSKPHIIIMDYSPKSNEKGKAQKSHLSSVSAREKENGSKYLPFQFVYKFRALLLWYGIQCK